MAPPDPVDARLLAVIAESGRVAVHEIATRLGMDIREVAARLAALSSTGLPIVVGVECDTDGIRTALANAAAWGQYAGQPHPPRPHPHPPAYPAEQYPPAQYARPAQQAVGPPITPPPGGPPVADPPSGPQPVPGQAAAPHPPHLADTAGPHQATSTWGPPGSASWTRAERTPEGPATDAQRGAVGSTLDLHGPGGERLAIQLVEVVDPADFLFTAAGYQLQQDQRALVVHTELTNRGTGPLGTLPDLYLVLVTADGETVQKAPVSLSSRPPHRIGIKPGETAGGHTVYVVTEGTEVVAVRWSVQPAAGAGDPEWDLPRS